MLEAGGGSWPAHLEAHVVGQAGEEVVLHVAADERVAEGPVEQGITGQVEHAQAHLVDALGLPIGREHGEADVLQERWGGSRGPPPPGECGGSSCTELRVGCQPKCWVCPQGCSSPRAKTTHRATEEPPGVSPHPQKLTLKASHLDELHHPGCIPKCNRTNPPNP